MVIKQKDFVEIEYTGKIKEEGIIFDTTDEKTAKDNGLHNPQMTYGPVVIVVGEKHVLPGIDEGLVGKEPGEYHFDLSPEKGFGKKDAKLIQLVPTTKFKKQNINPMPGLQVNFDGNVGTVKAVSGGRTVVDFNHVLSGKDLEYDVKVIRILTDNAEKVKKLLETMLHIKDAEVEVKEGKAVVELKTEMPKEVAEHLKKQMLDLIDLKDIEFKKEAQGTGEKAQEETTAEKESETTPKKEVKEDSNA